jgi:transcriptional regulator with XRE-family HTH domain
VSPRLPGSRPAPAPRTPEADRIAYGKTLRSWRETAGLTLAKLAARAEVSIASLSRYERGEVLPAAGIQVAIEAALRDDGAVEPGPLAGLEPWVRVELALMAGGGE